MDIVTLRPDHITDVLIQLHSGQWFTYQATEGVERQHTYSNLRVLDEQYEKPTEAFLNSKLAEVQGEFDAADYARKRVREYPLIGDQLDMQYHDLVDSTTTWADAIAAVKSKYPKPG